MKYKAIFFDLGGTLFSYRNVARTTVPMLLESAARLGSTLPDKHIKAAYAKASSELGRRYAHKPYYRHRDMFHDMFVRFVELIGAAYDQSVHDRYHETQQQALIDCLELQADCIATLSYLRDRELYLSIVSNIDNDMLEPLVARERLDRYLDHWTSSETAGSCKPDRRIFEFALAKSGCSAREVLFVGDSPDHDVAGAHAMGFDCALIVEKGIEPPLQSGRYSKDADFTIHSLADLREIVQ